MTDCTSWRNSPHSDVPLVDVVIPTYREGRWLDDLLDTLCEQDLTNVRVYLAYNIGEPVNLKKRHLDMPGLSIVRAAPGIGSGRNAGAAAGSADWILFLDADGLLPDFFLAEVKRIIRTCTASAATFNFYADSYRLSLRVGTRASWWYLVLSTLLQKPALPGFATLVRRRAFQDVAGYRNNLAISEDFVFSDDLLRAGHTIRLYRFPWLMYSARRFDIPLHRAIGLLYWYLKIDLERRFLGKHIHVGQADYAFGAHRPPYGRRRRPVDMRRRWRGLRQRRVVADYRHNEPGRPH